MKSKKKKRRSFQLKETLSQSLIKAVSSWICSNCKTINSTGYSCCKACKTLNELHQEKVSMQLNDQAKDYELSKLINNNNTASPNVNSPPVVSPNVKVEPTTTFVGTKDNMLMYDELENKYNELLRKFRLYEQNTTVNSTTNAKELPLATSQDANDNNELENKYNEVLRKLRLYELNASKSNDIKTLTSSTQITCDWDGICFAVAHEMWSDLSNALKSIIDTKDIKNNDLTTKTVNDVLNYLKTERNLLNEPVNYLKNLITRAINYKQDTGIDLQNINKLNNHM